MWVRLDDAIAHHPKFVHAGPEAFGLFVAGLCYCNRYHTDGLIPKVELHHLLPGLGERRAMELARRLAANGVPPSWSDEGDRFRVHDYELYQLARREHGGGEEAKRAQNAERQRRWRERQAQRSAVTHNVTRDITRYVTRDSNAVTRYSNAPLPEPLPPRNPVPSRKKILNAPAREERNAELAKRLGSSLGANGSLPSGSEDGGVLPVQGQEPLQPAPRGDGREQVRRASNAERQRRFRARNAARRAAARTVTQGVTPGAVTPDRNARNAEDGAVTRNRNALLAGLHPTCPAPSPGEPANAPGHEERDLALAKRLGLNGLPLSANGDGNQSPARGQEPSQPAPRGDGREQAKRARNAERQRRFRERNVARRAVARYVTLGVTPVTPDRNARNAENGTVTGNGNAPFAPLHPARPAPSRRELSNAPGRAEQELAPAKRLALNGLQAPSNDDGGQSPARLQLVPRGDGRDQAKRARNAERQRRFRERNAARRAVARYVTLGVTLGASFVTPDVTLGVTHDVTPVTPGSNAEDGARCDSNAPLARLHPARPAPSSRELSNAPARAERDLAAEFEAWFAAYPRQEGESRAQLAWMAERELPPLGVLLERLATQKTAKPQANFWHAPERYLREKRWRDQPPAQALAVPRPRSADAERRALGSDDSRRQRLREISIEAMFDPEASGA